MNKLTSIIEQNVRLQLRRINTTVGKERQTPSEYCLQLVRYLRFILNYIVRNKTKIVQLHLSYIDVFK